MIPNGNSDPDKGMRSAKKDKYVSKYKICWFVTFKFHLEITVQSKKKKYIVGFVSSSKEK